MLSFFSPPFVFLFPDFRRNPNGQNSALRIRFASSLLFFEILADASEINKVIGTVVVWFHFSEVTLFWAKVNAALAKLVLKFLCKSFYLDKVGSVKMARRIKKSMSHMPDAMFPLRTKFSSFDKIHDVKIQLDHPLLRFE